MLDIFNRDLLFITNITGYTSCKYNWKSYPVQRDSLATDTVKDHLRKKQNAQNRQRAGSLRNCQPLLSVAEAPSIENVHAKSAFSY